MLNLGDAIHLPSKINIDLTILRNKKKLVSLRRYIKSISNLENRVHSKFNDNKRRSDKYNTRLAGSLNIEDKEINGEKSNYEVEEKLETHSETGSESTISYNNSFVNELLERYNSSLKSKEIYSDLKENSRIPPINRRVRNIGKNNEENRIESKEIINDEKGNVKDMTSKKLNFRFGNTFTQQDQVYKNLLQEYDQETREIVENLDKKIQNLEDKVKNSETQFFGEKDSGEPTSKYIERCSDLELKLLSLSVIPPCGTTYFESSFLPFYCTFEETEIMKELFSTKGKLLNSMKTNIEITSMGKMFCYHARNRFINSIKLLYYNSLNVLKLKLLAYIEEPEMLLVNTFGSQPIENKDEIYFYEFDSLYKMKGISRVLICLIIINKKQNRVTKDFYSTNDTKRILPIYIIDINSTSS
ncbi:hypothetical protein HWI79_3656 [Cryptosporidium felis]|nr:hypothetical protein HWI79_3656 [Cryptosporidium felis]